MKENINCKIISQYDELNLAVLITEADAPKGVVQFSHGMAEHKERYLPIMEYLSENGYICVIHDHRGHGESVKSPDDLGYFYKGKGKAVVEDLFAVNAYIREQYPGLPVFLFGHSMGSLAVRAFVRKYDSFIDGLIVCGSPALNPLLPIALSICKLQKFFLGGRHRARFIDKNAFGSYNKNFNDTDEPFRWLSANRENVIKYQQSPLCGFCFTVNGFESLFYLMAKAYKNTGKSNDRKGMPVHFIAGGDDPCIAGKKGFKKAIKNMKKRGYAVTSKLYDGLRHEILNEKCCKNIFADVLEILEKMNTKR